jgi:hypothetical protein
MQAIQSWHSEFYPLDLHAQQVFIYIKDIEFALHSDGDDSGSANYLESTPANAEHQSWCFGFYNFYN